ncbi:hypothetical protein EDC56_2208 [Sinobacterium caligoides]|uniref:Uncharacterized protein n=1 Tax=Sinobacterium caligoides TaxID=933926 RepID=A0A3N2DPP2_9GAMM|nr:hypothetical protein [Sinobacterium caligoides]ROS01763.1 hypothetical protein EDC56_2208 [Sinobacterium caligoides]
MMEKKVLGQKKILAVSVALSLSAMVSSAYAVEAGVKCQLDSDAECAAILPPLQDNHYATGTELASYGGGNGGGGNGGGEEGPEFGRPGLPTPLDPDFGVDAVEPGPDGPDFGVDQGIVGTDNTPPPAWTPQTGDVNFQVVSLGSSDLKSIKGLTFELEKGENIVIGANGRVFVDGRPNPNYSVSIVLPPEEPRQGSESYQAIAVTGYDGSVVASIYYNPTTQVYTWHYNGDQGLVTAEYDQDQGSGTIHFDDIELTPTPPSVAPGLANSAKIALNPLHTTMTINLDNGEVYYIHHLRQFGTSEPIITKLDDHGNEVPCENLAVDIKGDLNEGEMTIKNTETGVTVDIDVSRNKLGVVEATWSAKGIEVVGLEHTYVGDFTYSYLQETLYWGEDVGTYLTIDNTSVNDNPDSTYAGAVTITTGTGEEYQIKERREDGKLFIFKKDDEGDFKKAKLNVEVVTREDRVTQSFLSPLVVITGNGSSELAGQTTKLVRVGNRVYWASDMGGVRQIGRIVTEDGKYYWKTNDVTPISPAPLSADQKSELQQQVASLSPQQKNKLRQKAANLRNRIQQRLASRH